MALKGLFFNSLGHDRRYGSADFANLMRALIGTGVYADPATNLQVISGAFMSVAVQTGVGWIDGYMAHNSDSYSVALENAHGFLNRIDNIVLRLDMTGRTFFLTAVTGVPSAVPAAPELVRDGTVYELCLARVTVPAGATVISQAQIKDTRFDGSLCGIVSRPGLTPDTTNLFHGYDVEWEAFKNAIGDADTAANLLNQILDLERKLKKYRLGGLPI